MVEIIFDEYSKKEFRKLDKAKKTKIIKIIQKLTENPKIGKPMRYSRKGTRELYIAPHRLSYTIKDDKILILTISHKDDQ